MFNFDIISEQRSRKLYNFRQIVGTLDIFYSSKSRKKPQRLKASVFLSLKMAIENTISPCQIQNKAQVPCKTNLLLEKKSFNNLYFTFRNLQTNLLDLIKIINQDVTLVKIFRFDALSVSFSLPRFSNARKMGHSNSLINKFYYYAQAYTASLPNERRELLFHL